MHRPDVEVVGVVERDDQLFTAYTARYHWPASIRFQSIEELARQAHPQAALVFTSTAGHRDVVKRCAALHIHVMMEKPMAVSYRDALAMADAARRGHVHVLVDYETSWYPSNKVVRDLFASGALGPLSKAVFRDGHNGPQKIHVGPEFFRWLTDPKENGAGALYDFGCYGVDLMTSLLHGDAPVSVTAVTKHLQPDLYPKVDDEADLLLNYKNAVAIVQGSWNWPFGVKDSDVYGVTGYAKTIGSAGLQVRRAEDDDGRAVIPGPLAPPYDDPIHYLAAVIRGDVEEGTDVSSLKVNLLVSQVLDAARQSARTGRAVPIGH